MWEKEKQLDVSNRVEEWSIAIPEVVRLLRGGQSYNKAYALLYVLRWELSRAMRDLPWSGGVPSKLDRDWAQQVLDSQRF